MSFLGRHCHGSAVAVFASGPILGVASMFDDVCFGQNETFFGVFFVATSLLTNFKTPTMYCQLSWVNCATLPFILQNRQMMGTNSPHIKNIVSIYGWPEKLPIWSQSYEAFTSKNYGWFLLVLKKTIYWNIFLQFFFTEMSHNIYVKSYK